MLSSSTEKPQPYEIHLPFLHRYSYTVLVSSFTNWFESYQVFFSLMQLKIPSYYLDAIGHIYYLTFCLSAKFSYLISYILCNLFSIFSDFNAFITVPITYFS